MPKLLKTPELEAQAVALYEDGCSFVEIGRAIGAGSETARKWLIAAGVHYPLPIGRDQATLARLYSSGVPVWAILEQHPGLNAATVYTAVRKHGIPLRYPTISKAAKNRKKTAKEAKATAG